ncbi:hypothetical protein [Actinomadura sp. HBU206391]|uniref:hypothetical protein n=1 Tax=Actinomadura sp. HBU206391 TaxID=2731692 RepID=UPI001650CC98|nr:hypothetical protein [Actinomadura sp. HBU206391]MBC6460685.1 hypothetical protein [Actinomadura sp. HBU206391]
MDDFGECVFTRDVGPPERFTIDRADPRILVSAGVLEEIRNAQPGEFLTFDGRPRAELDGDLLKIYGDNRTVIYRIGEKHDRLNYVAEWPD